MVKLEQITSLIQTKKFPLRSLRARRARQSRLCLGLLRSLAPRNDTLVMSFVLVLFVTLALTIPINSYAAPVVSAATGSFVQGGSVSVSGSGFGTGDTSILLWDDFEDGANGTNLNTSPKVGSWKLNGSPSPQYSTSHARSGSRCSYGQTTSSDMFTHFGAPASGDMPDTYYYVSFWFKFGGGSTSSGQTKFIQLWGTHQQGDYNPGVMSGGFYGDWWATYIALENAGSYQQEDYSTSPSKDTWHFCEMILKQSAVNTSDGQVTIKIDGKAVYNKTNVKTRERSGASWQQLWYFYGYTNQPSGGTKYVALDDVYMNNSWARVLIGNASAYTACTQFDIQPVDWFSPLWTDSEIRVRFNSGAYASGGTAYLYVVDANGNVNSNGYPIKIGSSASAPAPPKGLHIVQ